MACLLKTKTDNSPGIVSFTTQEELLIRHNKMFFLFKKLKNYYIHVFISIGITLTITQITY